jgi:hypothetical protein
MLSLAIPYIVVAALASNLARWTLSLPQIHSAIYARYDHGLKQVVGMLCFTYDHALEHEIIGMLFSTNVVLSYSLCCCCCFIHGIVATALASNLAK